MLIFKRRVFFARNQLIPKGEVHFLFYVNLIVIRCIVKVNRVVVVLFVRIVRVSVSCDWLPISRLGHHHYILWVSLAKMNLPVGQIDDQYNCDWEGHGILNCICRTVNPREMESILTRTPSFVGKDVRIYVLCFGSDATCWPYLWTANCRNCCVSSLFFMDMADETTIALPGATPQEHSSNCSTERRVRYCPPDKPGWRLR